MSNGVLTFDANGQILSVTGGTVSIDQANTGAATPQAFNLVFDGQSGSVAALADAQNGSTVTVIAQDGSPMGTLDTYSVGQDGTVAGIFTNGLQQTLGQVVLATFSNNNGLEEIGGNLYRPTPNSGVAVVLAPTSEGSGKIISRALEESNVDLTQESISLILASTGFTAAHG